MITLKVFFVNNNELGTATLIENLITNDVMLELSSKLLIGETKAFIEKAVKNLKTRYSEVKVDINWETADKVEEVDTNVTTSK